VEQKGYNISGIYVANDIAGYQHSSLATPRKIQILRRRGGFEKSKFLKESMKLNQNFKRGGRG